MEMLLKTIFLPSRVDDESGEIGRKTLHYWTAGELKQSAAKIKDVITRVRNASVRTWSCMRCALSEHRLRLHVVTFACVEPNIKYRSPIVWPPAQFSQSECASFVWIVDISVFFICLLLHRDYCFLCRASIRTCFAWSIETHLASNLQFICAPQQI